MVRAILDGRKSQTRWVVKRTDSGRVKAVGSSRNWHLCDPNAVQACPYGAPGDRLWVKETHRFDGIDQRIGVREKRIEEVSYRADMEGDPSCDDCAWRPSIFMPRWASRITLEVTGVRVERLQDISEADAIAEGIERSDGAWASYSPKFGRFMNPITSYHSLWESINGPGSWAANPWVWVIEFKRIHPTSEEGAGCVWSHIDNQRG